MLKSKQGTNVQTHNSKGVKKVRGHYSIIQHLLSDYYDEPNACRLYNN